MTKIIYRFETNKICNVIFWIGNDLPPPWDCFLKNIQIGEHRHPSSSWERNSLLFLLSGGGGNIEFLSKQNINFPHFFSNLPSFLNQFSSTQPLLTANPLFPHFSSTNYVRVILSPERWKEGQTNKSWGLFNIYRSHFLYFQLTSGKVGKISFLDKSENTSNLKQPYLCLLYVRVWPKLQSEW